MSENNYNNIKEIEMSIRKSRQNLFQIDHEAIFNGMENCRDYLQIEEYLDFEIFKYIKKDDEQFFTLQRLLLNNLYAKVDGYNWFNTGELIYSYKDLEEASYSINETPELHHIIFNHPSFPFGYKQDSYNRHKKIMMNRYKDIKEKLLIPPSFKDGSTYGLLEMQDYLGDKSKRGIEKRPKVKGKTFILNASNPKIIDDPKNGREFKTPTGSIFHREESFNKEFIINVTFINHLDNVEHPLNYLLDWKYKFVKKWDETLDYGWDSLNTFTKLLVKMGDGYASWDETLSNYDIICFNLFELPFRGLVVETVMNFLLTFHKKHPNIYIKDISGLGYYPYKNYPFYNELLASKIDVGI